MSNPDTSLLAETADDAEIAIQAEKRKRWFEVGLVVFAAFGSSILYSLYLLRNGPNPDSSVSAIRWAVSMVHEAAALLLLGYVLSRRGLSFRSIGLRWSPSGVGRGILVAGVSYVAYGAGHAFIRAVQHSVFGSVAAGPSGKDFFGHPPMVIGTLYCLLNPFFEELIVRAYLMTEVTELTGSAALAVVLSVVVQSSYHLYYGWVGAISLSFQFLTFALYYSYSRRALPIVVAHSLFDFYGLLLMGR
jgi:membrane protease YdiL (CAAX protease family)